MMESSAKTSSSDHNAFISSTAHLLLPNSNWIQSSAGRPMFCPRTTAFAFNLNNQDVDDDDSIDANAEVQLRGEDEIPKLSLFEKPLTPSDVGKLNRLVIPKQHAEKYFPLNGGGDSGMLLSFEDEVGKSWRFRYSYWNSSQSYVLTKGWSRFVKEKRLDAGDVVVFARHPSESARLFIGWRRRNASGGEEGGNLALPTVNDGGWNNGRAFYSGNPNNPWNQQHQIPPSLHHLHHHPHDFSLQTAGSVLQKQAAVTVSGHSKRLRLFGVNLECLAADDPEPMSSHHHQYYSNHMEVQDATFSGAEDAYQHQQG